MENPLGKVLRLASVAGFERRSPRGRLEHVRGFDRTGRSAASIRAHDTASATAKATWVRDDQSWRKLVQTHQAAERADAMHSQPAKAGTRAHAGELRSLAGEAELSTGRNYLDMKDSHEGPPSSEAVSLKAGTSKEAPPVSDTARILLRSADMIERGQPSMARLHAGSIRDAAKAEVTGNPDLLARVNAAADKLETLPAGKGLAAQPPATAEYLARTAAARRYAKRK